MRVNIDPAWAANASGIINCDDGVRNLTAVTTTTGTSAATAPLTLMNAVSTAHISIISTSRRRLLSPARATSCCPAHAVTPVASRASLTTNSDGDEQHRRIAEPGERLVEIEDVGRPQRQCRADGDDLDRHQVGDEEHDDPGEDEEHDRAVGHSSQSTGRRATDGCIRDRPVPAAPIGSG